MVKRPPSTEAGTEPEESFLTRWSRRKTQARDGSIGLETPISEASAGPAPAPATQNAPVLTDADLPPLDSLDQDSDFSAFLSPGVSEALRQRALRKLFTSAKFQIRDGLDDYDEDYRSFESLGETITASMRHRARLEAERLLSAEADPPQQVADNEPQAQSNLGTPEEGAPSDTDSGGVRT